MNLNIEKEERKQVKMHINLFDFCTFEIGHSFSYTFWFKEYRNYSLQTAVLHVLNPSGSQSSQPLRRPQPVHRLDVGTEGKPKVDDTSNSLYVSMFF